VIPKDLVAETQHGIDGIMKGGGRKNEDGGKEVEKDDRSYSSSFRTSALRPLSSVLRGVSISSTSEEVCDLGRAKRAPIIFGFYLCVGLPNSSWLSFSQLRYIQITVYQFM
jgi:hypothetical protein